MVLDLIEEKVSIDLINDLILKLEKSSGVSPVFSFYRNLIELKISEAYTLEKLSSNICNSLKMTVIEIANNKSENYIRLDDFIKSFLEYSSGKNLFFSDIKFNDLRRFFDVSNTILKLTKDKDLGYYHTKDNYINTIESSLDSIKNYIETDDLCNNVYDEIFFTEKLLLSYLSLNDIESYENYLNIFLDYCDYILEKNKPFYYTFQTNAINFDPVKINRFDNKVKEYEINRYYNYYADKFKYKLLRSYHKTNFSSIKKELVSEVNSLNLRDSLRIALTSYIKEYGDVKSDGTTALSFLASLNPNTLCEKKFLEVDSRIFGEVLFWNKKIYNTLFTENLILIIRDYCNSSNSVYQHNRILLDILHSLKLYNLLDVKTANTIENLLKIKE